MIKLLADENLNGHIVRGLLQKLPHTDILRAQDVGLSGADDRVVLAWAAEQDRVLLTHDISTITRYAYERVSNGLKMPGVIEVPQGLGAGKVLEDLALILECSVQHEWQDRLEYLPL